MKTIFPGLATALLLLSSPSFLSAQNSDAERVEEAGRNLFESPDFQNVLRSVKKDPEKAVESMTGNHESSVRQATELFMEGKKEFENSTLNTQENRDKVQRISEAAVSRATEMASENEDAVAEARAAIQGTPLDAAIPSAVASPVVPAPAEPTAETPTAEPVAAVPVPPANVPATRPASSSIRFVTPISMPEETVAKPLAADMTPEPVVQNESIEPIASAAPTEQLIPEIPELDPGSIPAPRPLSPMYDTKKGGHSAGAGPDEMVILSKHSIMDPKTGILTFTGNVFVESPDFDLKCDRLEIYTDQKQGAAPTESGGSLKKAIASGGMVEITRIVEGGDNQIALAKRAEFDNITKDVVLSGGPPYLHVQNSVEGDSYIETQSADAKIVMRGNGKYEITGSDAGTKGRSRIVIPVKDSGQNADTGIGGGLGGILDRDR
ncbi:MAG: LptA/OstA family protein [Verrucomicrobiota bacterium]